MNIGSNVLVQKEILHLLLGLLLLLGVGDMVRVQR